MKRTAYSLAILAAMGIAAPASAATFIATISSGCSGGFPSISESQTVTIPTGVAKVRYGTLGLPTATGECGRAMSARAGEGLVAISGDGKTKAGLEPRGYSSSATSIASARFDDFTFSAPSSYTGGAITVRLAFHLSGSIRAATTQTPGNFGRGTASLSARAVVSASGGYVGPPTLFESISVATDLDQGIYEIGDDLPGNWVTDPFQIDPRLPLTVTLDLAGTGSGSANFQDAAGGSYRADNTLSFRADNPFILPDGWTVNSVSANIVDNQWIDPRAAAVVPAPPALALLLGGLALLGRIRPRT